MPRRTGSAIFMSRILLFVILLPVPFLALHLDIPSLDSARETFLLSWVTGPGDPKLITVKILGCVRFSPEVGADTSDLYAQLTVTPDLLSEAINTTTPCFVEAFVPPSTPQSISGDFGIENTTVGVRVIPLVKASTTSQTSVTATTVTAPIGFGISSKHTISSIIGSILLTSKQPLSTAPVSVGQAPRSNHRGTLIGGVLGGLAFLALALGLGFLYCRRRRARRDSNHPHNHTIDIGSGVMPFPISSPFNPMRIPTVYRPPESKLERLERVRREMEQAQRLREAFQLDLERRGDMNGFGDAIESVSERADVSALRVQIEQMNSTIVVLRAEVQRQAEEILPPSYSSAVGS